MQIHAVAHTNQFTVDNVDSANDPSAGSPTETLLRLLLPLDDKVRETFPHKIENQ